MLGKKRKVEKVDDFYEVFKPVDNQPEDSYLINYAGDWLIYLKWIEGLNLFYQKKL